MKLLNNISVIPHQECVGCHACIATCPKSCISLKQEGLFFYPVVSEDNCVNCGKCIKLCPAKVVSVPNDDQEPNSTYYCTWNKNNHHRDTSTSGGVGAALAQYAIDKGYAVCGVTLSSKLEVKHIISETYEIIESIKGSKYVESTINPDIYVKILSYLKSGKKVLFFGTPCQVSALQNMVPSTCKDLLLTCEIICHGVNSCIVWRDYVDSIEQKYKSKILKYNFRSKSKGWGKLRISADFENGKHFDIPAWKNQFHIWFGQHYILRQSCFHCKYRMVNRQADITIGDFWGVEKLYPDLNVKDGVSVIIVGSSKAATFISHNPYLYLKRVDSISTSKVLKGYIEKRSDEQIRQEFNKAKLFATKYKSVGYKKMTRLYPCPTYYDLILNSIKFRINKYLKK